MSTREVKVLNILQNQIEKLRAARGTEKEAFYEDRVSYLITLLDIV